jgi:hypothetical protein
MRVKLAARLFKGRISFVIIELVRRSLRATSYAD